MRERCELGIQTFHDAAAVPPWIAICGDLNSLLSISCVEDPPEFAAVGDTETEAVLRLMAKRGLVGQSEFLLEKDAPRVVNLHRVRLMLRQAAIHGHNSTDLAVLMCLLAHYPRKVKMSVIKDETALPRQTAKRSLEALNHLVETRATGEATVAAKVYGLTKEGGRVCVGYLRMLI